MTLSITSWGFTTMATTTHSPVRVLHRTLYEQVKALCAAAVMQLRVLSTGFCSETLLNSSCRSLLQFQKGSYNQHHHRSRVFTSSQRALHYTVYKKPCFLWFRKLTCHDDCVTVHSRFVHGWNGQSCVCVRVCVKYVCMCGMWLLCSLSLHTNSELWLENTA